MIEMTGAVFIAVTVALIALTLLLFTVGRRVQHSIERDESDTAISQNAST